MIYEGWMVGVISPDTTYEKLQNVVMPCLVAGVFDELPSEEKVAEALKTNIFSAFSTPVWVNTAGTQRYTAIHTQLLHEAEQFGVNVPKLGKPKIIGRVAGIRSGEVATEDGSEISYVQQREAGADWLVIEDLQNDAVSRRKALAEIGVGLIRQKMADAGATDEHLRMLAESTLLLFFAKEKLTSEQRNVVGLFRNLIWELTGKYYPWFSGTIETNKQLSSIQHRDMGEAEADYYDRHHGGADWLEKLQFPAYYRDMLFTVDGELEYYQR